jgi:hypothetical protein
MPGCLRGMGLVAMAAILAHAGAARGAVPGDALIGTWTTPGSRVDGGSTLREGLALYVTALGRGGLVVSQASPGCTEGRTCSIRLGVPSILALATDERHATLTVIRDDGARDLPGLFDREHDTLTVELEPGKPVPFEHLAISVPRQLTEEVAAGAARYDAVHPH